MKKHWKRMLLIALAVVVAAAAAGLVYASPMFSMSPTPTGEVGETGILALHSGANSLFFLPAGEGYIVVDAGSSKDRVARDLVEIGVDPLSVTHVLLTHSDSDHVGALPLFSNAQIYL